MSEQTHHNKGSLPEQTAGDPRQVIPELFDVEMGEFLNGSHFIEVLTLPTLEVGYVSRGEGYAADYTEDFNIWSLDAPIKGYIEDGYIRGFLGGFPEISSTQSDERVKTLHLWFDNNDITSTSIAVPLSEIAEVRVYSELYLELMREKNNIEWGDNSSFSVPLLRRNRPKKGQEEVIYRKASIEDVNSAIENLAERPATIFYYPEGLPKELRPKRFIPAGKLAVGNLIDAMFLE
jgi:hypothetical protein